MKKRSAVILALVMLLCASLQAQVVPLDTIIARIEQNNPMLKEFDERTTAMERYAEGATSWMAPMVGFGPYWFPYRKQEATHDVDPEDGMYMAVFEQDIPNPMKIRTRKNYAGSRAAIVQEEKAVELNNLRAEARILYFNMIVLRDKQKILSESQSILDLMLRIARLRYPYNQSTLGMIYKTEGRLHEVENMQSMAAGEEESVRIRLNAMMNLSPHLPLEVDTAYTRNIRARNLYDTAQWQSSRSDLRQLRREIEAMRFNQQVQRSNARPDFKFRFEHMFQRDPAMPNQFSAMVMMTIPIAPWSSKMYRSEIKGMDYDIRAMERERDGIINESQGMIMSMQSQLH